MCEKSDSEHHYPPEQLETHNPRLSPLEFPSCSYKPNVGLDDDVIPVQDFTFSEKLDKAQLFESDENDFDEEGLFDNSKEEMYDNIRNWSVNYNITNLALSALLCILRTNKCFETLPNDARTFLHTPFQVNTKPVALGLYSHI